MLGFGVGVGGFGEAVFLYAAGHKPVSVVLVGRTQGVVYACLLGSIRSLDVAVVLSLFLLWG